MNRRSETRRNWPSRLPSRFRNFCITNDGDFFADAQTDSREEKDIKPIIIGHDAKASTSREPQQETETITIYTSSSDEEYAKAAEAPKVIARVLERCKTLGVKVPLPTSKAVIDISSSSDDDDEVVILSMTPESSNRQKAPSPLPPPKPGDEEPFFLCCHKKFNYKTRIRRKCKEDEGNNNHSCLEPVVIKREPEEKPATQSSLISVESLKLSPYISKKEAEQRLVALKNLEETQREIDNFAAIVFTGEAFRSSIQARVRERGLLAHSQPTPITMEVSSTGRSMASPPDLIPDPSLPHVSNHTSVSLGNGGHVIRPATHQLHKSSSSKRTRAHEDDADNGKKGNTGGGYFLLHSPSGSTGDDYEWISD